MDGWANLHLLGQPRCFKTPSALQEVAPGVSRQEISRLMALHQLTMGLSSGTPWEAQSYGSDLAALAIGGRAM